MTYEEKRSGYCKGEISLNSINIKDCMCFFRDRIWSAYTTKKGTYDIWLLKTEDVEWGRKVFYLDSYSFTNLMIGTKRGQECLRDIIEIAIERFEDDPREPVIVIIDNIKYEVIADIIETV